MVGRSWPPSLFSVWHCVKEGKLTVFLLLSGKLYVRVNNVDVHNIAKTARTLEKRLGEHQKQTTPAIREHQSWVNQEINWEGVKILDKESVFVKRKIQEAIHIRRPTLNRDGGCDFHANF